MMVFLDVRSLGRRLQHIRIEAGFNSAEQLAEAAGVNRNTIWRIETGKVTNVGIETLQQILRPCHTSLAEFFESKIPKAYPSDRHARLHNSIQCLIERDPEALEMLRTLIDRLSAGVDTS